LSPSPPSKRRGKVGAIAYTHFRLRHCRPGSIRLADLTAARERTVIVLGHEHDGIPDDAMELIDVVVEIPMIGTGASLNVAVAGSLVLYRLAGFL